MNKVLRNSLKLKTQESRSYKLRAKLYELTEDIKALEAMDLDAETLADSIDVIAVEFEEKAKGILAFTENMNGDIDALDSKIKRLTERKKVLTNSKNNLRA